MEFNISIDTDTAKDIAKRAANMESGIYKVTEAFDNPLFDKRAKKGIKASPSVEAGTAFRVSQAEAEDLPITETTVSYGKTSLFNQSLALAARDLNRPHLRMLDFMGKLSDNAEKQDETLGEVLNITGADVPDNIIFAKLVEDGALTIDQIKAAVITLDADPDSWDTLFRGYCLDV